MITVSKVAEIMLHMEALNRKEVLFLFDIDDTIISPSSRFGVQIDRLKLLKRRTGDKRLIDACTDLISRWRLCRKVILTDEAWPSFLEAILHLSSHGLTKMHVGKVGMIESMEKWRCEELHSLGVKFNPIYPVDSAPSAGIFTVGVSDATFLNGLFFTGNATKGDVVRKILHTRKYDAVCFVDDRLEQLQDVGRACDELGVDCLLLHFQMYCDQKKAEETQIENEIIKFLEQHEA